jgi:hypothetical protein
VLGGWGWLLVGALTFQVKSFKLGFPLRRCGQDWFQEGQGPTDWVCSKVSEQIMKVVLLVVKTCKNNHKIETNINKSYGRCYRANWEGSIPSIQKPWMWWPRSRHDPRSANLAPVTILKRIFHSHLGINTYQSKPYLRQDAIVADKHRSRLQVVTSFIYKNVSIHTFHSDGYSTM